MEISQEVFEAMRKWFASLRASSAGGMVERLIVDHVWKEFSGHFRPAKPPAQTPPPPATITEEAPPAPEDM